MVVSGSLTEKKKIITDYGKKILGEITNMMLTKYFILLCILLVMVVSIKLIDSMRSVESVMIYTAGNDVIGYRSDNLFGILGQFVNSFTDWILISNLIYMTFVIITAAIVFTCLKNIDDKILKVAALLGCGVFIYGISYIPEDTTFSLAVGMMPVLSAYLMMFTKYRYLAPLFTAVGTIIDPRSFIICLPMAIASYYILNLFGDSRENKNTVTILVLTIISSGMIFLIVEYFISVKNPGSITQVKEFLENKYTAFFDGTGTEKKYIDYAITNISENRTTPLTTVIDCFEINPGMLYDIQYYGGIFLIAFAYVIQIVFFRYKEIIKDGKKNRFLLSSVLVVLYLLWLSGRSFCIILYILSLCVLKISYHRKKQEKILIKEDRFIHSCIIIVVVVRLMQIIICTHPDNFPLTQYYLDYGTFGFMPRLLIGSIFVKLMGGTFTQAELLTVMTVVELIITLCEAFLFLIIYRHSEEKTEKNILLLLMLMYAVSPASSTLSNVSNTLKLDWFLVALSSLCIWALYKNNKLIYLLPVSCIIAMLTHHVFICILFPLIFILMTYRAFIKPDGYMVRNTSIMVISLIVTSAMFFWFNYMYEPPDNITVEYMCSIIDTRSELTVEPHYGLLRYMYLGTPDERIANYTSMQSITMIITAAKIFFISLPLFALFVYMLAESVKQEKKLIKKLAYIVMGISFFVTIGPFFTDCDYGRWCSFCLKTVIVSLIFITAVQPLDKKWYYEINKKRLKIIIYATIILQAIMPSFDQMLLNFPLFVAW